MAYATPSNLLAFIDARLIGDLVNDQGVQLTPTQILTDPNVLNSLSAGSGIINSAILVGTRYTEAQLAALTGDDLVFLQMLNSWLAFGILATRRGIDTSIYPEYIRAQQTIDSIKSGVHVFGVPAGNDALPSANFLSAPQWNQVNTIRTATEKYFPTRRIQHPSPPTAGFVASGSGGGGGCRSFGTVTSITAGSGLTGGTITTNGTIALANPVSIADGGTGQQSANAGLNALLPTQTGNAAKVLSTDGTNTKWTSPGQGTVTSITAGTGLTGGTITSNGTIALSTPVSIANGGTGQITANASLNALLPSQTGNNGLFLTTNGTNTSWAVAGAVSSISNSDGTLTISPTTGAVVASLALGHANTWTGQQTFTSTSTYPLVANTGSGGPQMQVGANSYVSYFTNAIYPTGGAILQAAGTWKAESTSAASIGINDGTQPGAIIFQSDKGLTSGNTFSPTIKGVITNYGVGWGAPAGAWSSLGNFSYDVNLYGTVGFIDQNFYVSTDSSSTMGLRLRGVQTSSQIRTAIDIIGPSDTQGPSAFPAACEFTTYGEGQGLSDSNLYTRCNFGWQSYEQGCYCLCMEAGSAGVARPISFAIQDHTNGVNRRSIQLASGLSAGLGGTTTWPIGAVVLGEFAQMTSESVTNFSPIDMLVLHPPTLTSSGTQDSHHLLLVGNGYDSSAHLAYWRERVHVTAQAGASTWILENQIDSAGYITKLSITDGGLLTASSAAISPTSFTLTPAIRSSGSANYFTITSPADTTLTASTECIGVNFNLSATRQFATGALTTQRECVFQAPTYSAVGSSTITTAATVDITGAPAAGTNVSITNPYALRVEAGQSYFGSGVTVLSSSSVPFIVRQSGGTPGTNEGDIYHDGTYLNIVSQTSVGGNGGVVKFPQSTNVSRYMTVGFSGGGVNLQTAGGTFALTSDITGSTAGSCSFYANSFSTSCFSIAANQVVMPSGSLYSWSSSSTGFSSIDTALARNAANNVGFTNGSSTTYATLGSAGFFLANSSAPSTPTGGGALYTTSGVSRWLDPSGNTSSPIMPGRLAANATNATASMSNLSFSNPTTLVAGRKYIGWLTLYANNSTAAEGIQFDFNGGSATMTSFEAGFAFPPIGATLGTTISTSLSTALTATTATTADTIYRIDFTLVCANAGTFIPRFAEVSHVSGTATVEAGSNIFIEDCP